MIELPECPAPNGVAPYAIDFGYWLNPSTGAQELRVDRKGGRFGGEFTLPPMKADTARVVVSRLVGCFFGDTLRIEYPLLDVPQGSPGSPVVDGAGQAGTTLALRGLTPGYAAKEGYWLTVVDENGRGYLHNVRASEMATADGRVTLNIAPELRVPLLDGAEVRLARPTIEGRVPTQPWQLPTNRLVIVGFKLEEVA